MRFAFLLETGVMHVFKYSLLVKDTCVLQNALASIITALTLLFVDVCS